MCFWTLLKEPHRGVDKYYRMSLPTSTLRGLSRIFVSRITAPVSGLKVTLDLPPWSKSTMASDRLSQFFPISTWKIQ